MNIYFLSSPRGKTPLGNNYKLIYDTIESLGHKNVTDFVKTVDADKFYLSDISKFYSQTMKDLSKANVCIFETSTPSLAVGHLISTAIHQDKPIIALYYGNNVPFFLSGAIDEKIQLISYTEDTLKEKLKDALEYASNYQEVRFNFFISPSIGRYLDWISKEKKIPRSVYLRALIEREMRENEEYNEKN